jgi:hypothetical protein
MRPIRRHEDFIGPGGSLRARSNTVLACAMRSAGATDILKQRNPRRPFRSYSHCLRIAQEIPRSQLCSLRAAASNLFRACAWCSCFALSRAHSPFATARPTLVIPCSCYFLLPPLTRPHCSSRRYASAALREAEPLASGSEALVGFRRRLALSLAKNRVAIRTVSYSPVVHVSRISETSANSIWRSNRRL